MDALRQYLVAERDRRILWVPVIFAMGIGCYFGLRWEPHWATGPAAMLASALWYLPFSVAHRIGLSVHSLHFSQR